MLNENAVLGGEGNGGVIDPRVGYVRDSFVAMALVLDLLAATGAAVVPARGELTPVCDGQGPVPTGDGRTARQTGHQTMSSHSGTGSRRRSRRRVADRRDGLRLDWNDRWVHIRASNTEPIVRVIAESADPSQARELADRIGRWVSAPPEDQP